MRLRGAFLAWLLVKYAVIRPDSFLVFLPLLSVLSVVVKSCIFWVKSRLIINEGVVLSNYLSIRGMLWMRFVIQFVYNASDQIIVPTTACRDDLISTFRVIDSKILVIPNWTLLVSKKNVKSDYDIIYIGRFDTEKNVLSIPDCISAVMAYHPRISVLLLGSGPLLCDLRERISALGLSSVIEVQQFDVNIVNYLNRSKILYLPSHNEGMPNVVLEAASCSVPSVVSEFMGSREIVDHGITGFIGKTNAERVAYLNKLLSDETLRRRMGANARRHIYKFFSKKAQIRFIDALLE